VCGNPLGKEEYRQQIVAFARLAKVPFIGQEKVFEDDFDRQQYAEFWEEYDKRLVAVERANDS
jgi:hypothetical protein